MIIEGGGKLKAKQKAGSGAPSMRKTLCWMIIFVAIAAISVYTVAKQSVDFSSGNFVEYIKNANIVYLTLSVLLMIGFIVFEGVAVITICRAFGYKRGVRNGFIYSASDIYFSAITPSATGGQPASMWFMMKDGIPGTTSVVALLVNLVFYIASILLVGIITFVFAPGMFFDFSSLSKMLIIAGFFVLTFLATFFILILFKESIVYAFSAAVIKLLSKIKLVKHPERLNLKLKNIIHRYKECAALILKNKKLMLFGFGFNLLQRFCQITVTMFTYLAVGGSWGQAANAWFVQSYAVLGSNIVPIPGAMGVSDYLLLDGLGNLMPNGDPHSLEILSRAISFYSMIVICGVAIFIKYILISKNKNTVKESK